MKYLSHSPSSADPPDPSAPGAPPPELSRPLTYLFNLSLFLNSSISCAAVICGAGFPFASVNCATSLPPTSTAWVRSWIMCAKSSGSTNTSAAIACVEIVTTESFSASSAVSALSFAAASWVSNCSCFMPINFSYSPLAPSSSSFFCVAAVSNAASCSWSAVFSASSFALFSFIPVVSPSPTTLLSRTNSPFTSVYKPWYFSSTPSRFGTFFFSICFLCGFLF